MSDISLVTEQENLPGETGTEFIIQVKVGDPRSVNDLLGLAFTLQWSGSDVIEGVASSAGPFWGNNPLFVPQIFNNRFEIGVSSTSGGKDGSGIIALCTLRVTQHVADNIQVLFSLSDITAMDALGNDYELAAPVLPLEVSIMDPEEFGQAVLAVEPSQHVVTSSAGNASSLVSNTGAGVMHWHANVVQGQSWLQISSGDSGSNDGAIVVGYEANTGDERTGIISVTAENTEESPQTVSVIQQAAVTAPKVTTDTVTGITQHDAQGGGNVISGGGADVTDRGLVYATTGNPTLSDNQVTSGSGTGAFTVNMTGLKASTTYYVRAYATNAAGTAFGNQVQFTTMEDTIVITPPKTVYIHVGIVQENVEACFPSSYQVKLEATPHDGGQVTGAGEYLAGDSVTVNAIADEAHHFVKWADHQHHEVSPEPRFTFEMPSSNVLLIAHFARNHAVTFNVNMTYVDGYHHPFTFNPNYHKVNVTGDMFDWQAPGENPDLQTLIPSVLDPKVFSKSIHLPPGTYEYRYYINEGWTYAEWDDNHNRSFSVNNSDIILNDWFGNMESPTGVLISVHQGLAVFPVPAYNQISIHLNEGKKMHSIRMTDMAGQEVLTADNLEKHAHLLHIGHLNEGVYLVQVFTSDTVYTSRFMISR